ncbi:DUF397 domain-containing protein [Streptomyces spongiae]|uniref:DUF397 domain-containing protein n=1 Tax=Streptomyces spongiae TaxID=565072 RepID=A0A5N8XZT0_9ACTN|nr:DUF397 domain-containing protein [Streptomyces spongiae]MPY64816.1 DUF397 domain-containing protein [Streptomyces spongiae]
MREYDLSKARWRKSSYSGGSGGEDCVEVADGVPSIVPVRDTKSPLGPVLLITPAAWTEFIGAVTALGEGAQGLK